MKTNYLSVIFITFVILACQSCSSNETARSKNSGGNNVVTNLSKVDKQVAEAQKAAANSNVKQAKYYPGTGVVTGLRKNEGVVELDHEEIKGIMPAMKMMFNVKMKEQLLDLKVGDKVNFVLEDDSGTEQISTIYKK